MNYDQVFTLFLQSTLVAFVIMLLFRLRQMFGIGVLFACLGLFKFVEIFLSNTVFTAVTSNFLIGPGSSIFITATFFAILVIYINEDAIETKRIIYALFIVNFIIIIFLSVFGWTVNDIDTYNSVHVTTKLFKTPPWVNIVSNITLFIDAFLIIYLFEYFSSKVKYLFLQILTTMFIVVVFDTLFFSLLSFWNSENLLTIITKGLLSKSISSVYYSIIFYFYLKFFNLKNYKRTTFKAIDIFEPLTYKQKFNSAILEIKKNEELYRLLTDNSNDIICLQDLDGNYKYISPSIKNILGYEQTHFLNKKIYSIVHKDDLPELKSAIKKNKFSNKHALESLSFRLRHIKGHYIWIEYTTSPIFENNEIISFVTSAREITERVNANKKIKDSLKLLEEKENSIKETSKIAKIGYVEYDIINNSYTWSDYNYKVFGIDPKKEPPNMQVVLNLLDKNSQEKLKEAIQTINLKGISTDIELKGKNLKDEIFWVRHIAHPIYNDENKLIGRRTLLQDITDYKKAQLALEKSNIKIKTSLDLLEKRENILNDASKIGKIGYFEYDIPTDTFTWSEYLYHMYGLDPTKPVPPRDEIVELISKDTLQIMKQATINHDLHGIPYDIEMKIINKKTKKEVWVRNVSEPVFNKDKKVIGRRGIAQDITARKTIQLEMEKTNEVLKNSLTLLEISEQSKNDVSKVAKIGYIEYNKNTATYKWSDYVYEMLEFDPKKGIPSTQALIELFSKKSQIRITNAINAIDQKGIPCDIVMKIVKKNKQNLWIRYLGQPVYKDNKIVGRKGILQNITEQKLKQKKLDVQNEKLSKLNKDLVEAQRISNLGNWEYITKTDILTCSIEILNILGLPENLNQVKLSKSQHLYPKESYDKMMQAVSDCIKHETPYNIELEFFAYDGSITHLISRGRVLKDKNKKVIGCYGTAQDITEQKRIQLEIEKTKEMYRLVTDNSNDIISLHDGSSILKYISPSVKSLLGYEQTEFIGKPFYKGVHYDDLSKLKESIKERKFSNPISFRVKHKDGHFVWLESLSSVAYKEENTTYFVSTARDITQAKLAKEEIQKYQKSLQKLTTEITVVEENQKKEIATNIHDNLSQSLVISNMRVKALKKNPALKNIEEDLDFIRNHIDAALVNSRRITSELSPPILYQLGIIEALHWLLENIKTTYKIDYEIIDNVNEIKLNDVKSILVYRSVQEIINNIIKYAQATLITVYIDKYKKGVNINIKDNGVGFDTSKLNKYSHNGSGFGLFKVKERIRNIRGKFIITSEINKGTNVNILIPLKKNEATKRN